MILTLPLGPIQTNCYLVSNDDSKHTVIIDPGGEPEKVQHAVSEQGLTVQAVWLTHAHFDHIGAVPELVETYKVPLALHPQDLSLYRLGGGAAMFGIRMGPLPQPDLMLEHGHMLTLDAWDVEVRFVPGHTLGHVAFYFPALKAVFSGDVLFQNGVGRTDLPGGSFATLESSIREQLFTLPDATTVYSGHGPATTIGAEKRFNPFVGENG